MPARAYCPTCDHDTDDAPDRECPFCATPVTTDDAICPTCRERVAPVWVCAPCGTPRPEPGAPERPVTPMARFTNDLLRAFVRAQIAERERPIPPDADDARYPSGHTPCEAC